MAYESLPFRMLRRIGSLPSILILIGLTLGALSAAQAIANAVHDVAVIQVSAGGVFGGSR